MKQDTITSKNKGFTLLELLVVVAIIAFLSSVSIVALSLSAENSRDKTRRLDQLTIIKAVELYRNDFGAPPQQLKPITYLHTNRLTSLDTANSPIVSQFQLINRAQASFHLEETIGFCGDGVVGPTEQCDDGLLNKACQCGRLQAQCSNTCEWNICTGYGQCGNGILDVNCAEQCDDGPLNNGACPLACNSSCQINSCGPPSVCGDGTVDPGEQCDDGNTTNGDGCNSSCQDEVCGNNVLDVGEECDDGNTTNGDGCDSLCRNEISGCDSDTICEPSNGENVGNCPSDCSSGGETPATCGNPTTCDVGETFGNCPSDCTEISMCYVNGEWDVCCVDPDVCEEGESSISGYYGQCKGNRCEQIYSLKKPAAECTSDADCSPGTPGQQAQDKFVPSNDPTVNNWLLGLAPYLVNPKIQDPGHHNDPQYDHYYCSSHPEIVSDHNFCCWISFENESANFNPYSDLPQTPTGPLDPRWTPLCVD